MTVRINRALNLIVPIYSGDGKDVVAHVHSIPLAEEVVDRYFLILGQTYNAIMSSGLGVGAGPGVAMRMLKMLAVKQGEWESRKAVRAGEEDVIGVKDGLVEEMRRCTNVLAPVDGRWTTIPLAQAEARGYIDAEDRAEVENAIVFFMSACATLPRDTLRKTMELVSSLWSAQTSSSTPSEFISSLQTSSETGNSGGTAKPATEAVNNLPPDEERTMPRRPMTTGLATPAPAAAGHKRSSVPY
jgi:hypothetical protein